MGYFDLNTLTWRKSSYSGTHKDGNCVEVARGPQAVVVRDSKDLDGPTLVVSPAAFVSFVRGLRQCCVPAAAACSMIFVPFSSSAQD